MLRVHIVEDVQSQADALELLLRRYGRERGLDLNVTRSVSALELIDGHQQFDLVFLDIRLPGINGMSAAEQLRAFDETTPIIFVTDLAQYAVRGYQVDALDFMVKPVSYHDLKTRMDRALRVIDRERGRSLFLRTRDGMRRMASNEVAFVEVFDHRLVYHLISGETVSHRGRLGDLEGEEGYETFVRISNSCMANMANIRSISGAEMLMANGEKCYLTKSRRREALERIANYYGADL